MEKKNNQLKVVLIREKLEGPDTIYSGYQVGDYQVATLTTRDGECLDMQIWVKTDDEDFYFFPSIYFRGIDCDNSKERFTINTTAYGALDAKDIKKVQKGYSKALEVVDALTETFFAK